MLPFLQFFYNEGNMQKWLRDEWLKIYDVDYVDTVLIAGVSNYLTEADELILYLDDKTSGRASAVVAAASKTMTTKVEPFQLTKPKPRRIPEPEVIPVGFKAQPVPPSTYAQKTKSEEMLEERKRAQREQLLTKYEDPRYQPFELRAAARPSNLQKIKEEVEKKEAAACNFKGMKPNKVPNFAANSPTVRLNAAAVLRENAIFRKKQENEAKVIKSYEEDLRDASEFYAWQEKMMREDARQRAEEIVRRKKEMAEAAELAILSKERKVQENRKIVEEMSEESEILKKELEKQEQKDARMKKARVEAVVDSRIGVAIAKQTLLEEKEENAKKMAAERRERELQVAEALEMDRLRKEDLIRQIRALERVPLVKAKVYDRAQSSGVGLLGEMSYLELTNRLEALKDRQEQIRREKHAEILQAKQAQAADLAAKMEQLGAIRTQAAQEAAAKKAARAEAQKREEEAKEKQLNAGYRELHSRMAAKRQERKAAEAALRQEQKEQGLKNQFLAAEAGMVEESRWKEQEKGAEREVKERIGDARKSAQAQATIKSKRSTLIKRNRKEEAQAKSEFMKSYNNKLATAKEANAIADEYEQEMRRHHALEERQMRTLRQEKRNSQNPYAASISEKSLAKSRQHMRSKSPGKKKEPVDILRKETFPAAAPSDFELTT